MPFPNAHPYTDTELATILRRTMFASKSRALPASDRDLLYAAVIDALDGHPYNLRLFTGRLRHYLRPHRGDPSPLP